MVEITHSRVNLEISGACATIALAREDRLNAFDVPMHVDLLACLNAAAENPDVRAIILTGVGRSFSAGQDLAERAATFEEGRVPDLRASLDGYYNPLLRKIASLPVPVIAAVNGVAFGAGAGIAIGCDIVLATESARFQFGFVHVGLGPDSGVSHFLPQIVGHARALDIALTGRPLDAAEALEIGLVSRVVPDGALSAVTLEVAGGFAKRSAAALAETKRQMRNNPLKSLDQALDSERDVQSALGETAEYRDAVLRFTQKK